MATTTLKCLTCGAELKYNPADQNWKCEFCDSVFTETDFPLEEEELNLGEGVEATPTPVDTETGAMVAYQCSYCGAEVVTAPDTVATFCVFCGRPVVMENNVSGAFQPQGILPFIKTKEEALEALSTFTKGKLFLPKAFRDQEHMSKITGVYVPFWLFDATANFRFAGTGQLSSTWSDSNFHYTKTDTYAFVREGSLGFSKVPVDGSTKAEDRIMDSISPFDFSQLKKFATPYLSGFLAERYDVSPEECYARAASQMTASNENKVRSTVSYGAILPSVNTCELSQGAQMYTLLPVWMLSTTFEDKQYMFAMNGQTGKFVGSLPVDKKKVTLASVLSFLGATVVGTIVAYLMLG